MRAINYVTIFIFSFVFPFTRLLWRTISTVVEHKHWFCTFPIHILSVFFSYILFSLSLSPSHFQIDIGQIPFWIYETIGKCANSWLLGCENKWMMINIHINSFTWNGGKYQLNCIPFPISNFHSFIFIALVITTIKCYNIFYGWNLI